MRRSRASTTATDAVPELARLNLLTTREVYDGLLRLQATGFYGASVEDTAEELLRHRLREIEEQRDRQEHARQAREKKEKGRG